MKKKPAGVDSIVVVVDCLPVVVVVDCLAVVPADADSPVDSIESLEIEIDRGGFQPPNDSILGSVEVEVESAEQAAAAGPARDLAGQQALEIEATVQATVHWDQHAGLGFAIDLALEPELDLGQLELVEREVGKPHHCEQLDQVAGHFDWVGPHERLDFGLLEDPLVEIDLVVASHCQQPERIDLG